MRKTASIAMIVVFFAVSVKNPVFAQPASEGLASRLPMPGAMVHLSPEFTPAHLQGITIHPTNALQFDFLINRGDQPLEGDERKAEYKKLVKYFLASLTIPDEDQWVNLSPYEHDRIIKDDFGKTQMGRDLLTQDYILKQITSSLIYPEDSLGKKFWDKIYERAWNEYHTTDIPVNTFNKVWIVPNQAFVYESGDTAYILHSHLKVMLEEDYLSLEKHVAIPGHSPSKTHTIGSQVIREIILPELEREVNEGKNFANLRQMYSGMILATWYKKALKESLLGQIYADKGKVKGIDQNPENNEEIYQRYLSAFKKGVFNYIKQDVDKYTNEPIPRKYFSGGYVDFNQAQRVTPHANLNVDAVLYLADSKTVGNIPPEFRAAITTGNIDSAMVDLAPALPIDAAMNTMPILLKDGVTVPQAVWENVVNLWEKKSSVKNESEFDQFDAPTKWKIEVLSILVSYIKGPKFSQEKSVKSFQESLQEYLSSFYKPWWKPRLKTPMKDDYPYLSDVLREYLLSYLKPQLQGKAADKITEELKKLGLVEADGTLSLGVITLIRDFIIGDKLINPVSNFMSQVKGKEYGGSHVAIGNYYTFSGEVHRVIDARHSISGEDFNEHLANNEVQTNIVKLVRAFYKGVYGKEPTIKDREGKELQSVRDAHGVFVQLKKDGPWFLILQTGVETLGPGQGIEPRSTIIDLARMKVIAGNVPYFKGDLNINAGTQSVSVTVNDGRSFEVMHISIEEGGADNRAYLEANRLNDKYMLVLEQDVGRMRYVLNIKEKSNEFRPWISHDLGGDRKKAQEAFEGVVKYLKIGSSQFRLDQFGDDEEKVRELITDITKGFYGNDFILGSHESGIDWINQRKVPFLLLNNPDNLKRLDPGIKELVEEIKAHFGGKSIQELTPNQLTSLANSPQGMQLKRAILEAFHRSKTPRRTKIEPTLEDVQKWIEFNQTTDAAMSGSTGEPVKDPAVPAVNEYGGIDFNAANLSMIIKRDGHGVPLPLVQQDMAQLNHIDGFEPEIIEIRPAVNLPVLSELQQKMETSST